MEIKLTDYQSSKFKQLLQEKALAEKALAEFSALLEDFYQLKGKQVQVSEDFSKLIVVEKEQ